MKKFRVEVDGEEFIVNVEEIGSEAGSSAVKSTASAGSRSTAAKAKAAPKKAAPKPKTKPQKEMASPAEAGEGDVVAPMPGSILEINVKKGETVAKGDNLIVLEAMKMETDILSDMRGKIESIFVSVDDQVESNQLLIKLHEA